MGNHENREQWTDGAVEGYLLLPFALRKLPAFLGFCFPAAPLLPSLPVPARTFHRLGCGTGKSREGRGEAGFCGPGSRRAFRQ